MSDRSSGRLRERLRPRKPVALGSFLVVAVAAAALFAPTFSAHVAVMNAASVESTPTDCAVAADGDRLAVELRVRNPTRSALTVSYGDLSATVGGTQVTEGPVELDEATIPAGEARTVTARVGIEDSHRRRVAAAVASGRLSVTGRLRGAIRDAEVEIGVTGGNVSEGDGG